MFKFYNPILNRVITIGKGNRYLALHNTVGQQWLFPYDNPCLGLSLFQPSSKKGAFVLKSLPILKRVPFLLKYMNVSIQNIEFSHSLMNSLKTVFEVDSILISIFCGSPGKHMKPTLLIESKGEYLGYCKVSSNKDIIEIFQKESSALEYLFKCGLLDIPKVKYCAPMHEDSDLWLFAQTTQRKRNIKLANYESDELMSFVAFMHEHTKKQIAYRKTDFYKCIRRLEDLLPLIKSKLYSDTIRHIIKCVDEKLTHRNVEYASYHGDLTPWNSFIIDKHLFAFDFEYFQTTYTPYADYFHFFTQSLIYNEYATGEDIYSRYVQLKDNQLSDWGDCDLWYTCYLLCVMEFYLNRDHGFLNDRIASCFDIWSLLLSRINNICINY